MFQLTIKELAARKLRLLATAFAVLLGVAFMAGTLVFTDTIGATFDSALAEADAGRRRLRQDAVRDRPRLRRTRPPPRRLTRRHRRLRRRRRPGGAAHQRLRPAGRSRRATGRRRLEEPGVRHELGRRSTNSTRTSWPAAMLPPAMTRSSSTRRAPTRPATSRVTSRPCSRRARPASSRSPASPSSVRPTRLPGRRRCCSPTRPPQSCWRRPGRPTRSPSPPTPERHRRTSPRPSRPPSAATSRSSPAPR